MPPPRTLRSSCPYAPGVSARPAGHRSPSIHPSCLDSAGEWASTFACRRESSTSSLTSSRPAIIEYFHEVHLLPLAASSRSLIATERRLHHEHRRRPRRRAGAQVGEGALVVVGGERRGSEHGVDPPRWASRSSVQETCIPSRVERELDSSLDFSAPARDTPSACWLLLKVAKAHVARAPTRLR